MSLLDWVRSTNEHANSERLVGRARESPEAVLEERFEVYGLLDAEDPETRTNALRTLRRLLAVDERVVDPVLTTVVEMVDGDDAVVSKVAAYTVGDLASIRPDAVVEALPVDRFRALLSGADAPRGAVASVFAGIAHDHPGVAVDAAPELGDLLDSGSDVARAHAAAALAGTAREYPDAVLQVSDRLVQLVGSSNDAVRASAIEACYRLGRHEPSVVEPIDGELAAALSDGDESTRYWATTALGGLLRDDPTMLPTAHSELPERLADDSPAVRQTAAAAYVRIAHEHPGSIRDPDRVLEGLERIRTASDIELDELPYGSLERAVECIESGELVYADECDPETGRGGQSDG